MRHNEKKNRSSCSYKRKEYVAKKAQAECETVLVESRTGIQLNKESFCETDRIISRAVQNGQHICHAIVSAFRISFFLPMKSYSLRNR